MDYREFMEQVKKDLPERLSGVLEGATVDTTQVDKLQGRSYEGLSIAPDGSMIGLTMDLQPYFQMFNDGISYENIVEQIADRAIRGLCGSSCRYCRRHRQLRSCKR